MSNSILKKNRFFYRYRHTIRGEHPSGLPRLAAALTSGHKQTGGKSDLSDMSDLSDDTPLDSSEPLGNSPPSIATADVLRSKVAGKSRSRQGSGLVSMTADGNEDFPRDCPQDAAALIVPQDSISR